MALSARDKTLLKRIHEPEIVAVPPANPHRGFCVLPDGEIRFYGEKSMPEGMARVFIASRDAGLSWKLFLVPDDEENGPMIQSPWSGEWLTILRTRNYNIASLPALNKEVDGVYAIRSKAGPGSTEHSLKKISSSALLDIRQPIPMRSSKRWLCTAQKWHDGALTPVVLLSDDDGFSWKEVVLKSVPPHVPKSPHQGPRWQQYSCEPTVVELAHGRLMLISRTSQDFHYVYHSEDAGETWGEPKPSEFFHATTTMPTLLRLSDGRILFFWCNTQPLPELDHATQPELSDEERRGVWEDVFTNRDACHAAISEDDGKSWRGFREVHLNEIRNHADFRSFRSDTHNDKSIHQFEAVEISEGKVLLAFGQAPSSRRMVIFDPAWLYEASRAEDFSKGLENLSTHVYVKSLSGGKRAGFSGHCAWNRTNGALLLPSPDGSRNETLHISRIHDERLFNELQGAAWNYPAARKGRVQVELRIEGAGLRLSLSDRWFNPCDPFAPQLSQLSVSLAKGDLPLGPFWSVLELEWDLDERKAKLRVNGETRETLTIKDDAPAGFSYLHLQSAAKEADPQGSFIKTLRKD